MTCVSMMFLQSIAFDFYPALSCWVVYMGEVSISVAITRRRPSYWQVRSAKLLYFVVQVHAYVNVGASV